MEFNKLMDGNEEEVVDNILKYYEEFLNSLPIDSHWASKNLLINAIVLLKRLNGNKTTIIDLSRILSNSMGAGRNMVMAFAKHSAKPNTPEALKKENDEIADYFFGDYYNEKSKTYDLTISIRSIINCNKYFYRDSLVPNLSMEDAADIINKSKTGILDKFIGDNA